MENGQHKELVLPDAPDIKDVTMSRHPRVVLDEAARAAQALSRVIETTKKKPVIFNGERYLEFEDWALLGKFYGITAKVIRTSFVEFGDTKGFEARAVAFHVPTGQEVSGAEAVCLDDEPNWRGKPLFQLKSMAQTRASAKALRNVLSWIVVLAGYKPTPAEEMTGHEFSAPVAAKPEEPFAAKSHVYKGVIALVKEKGQTSTGKRYPYTVQTVDGYVFKTWDDALANRAVELKALQEKVVLEYKETRYGLDVVSLEKADETPQPETPSAENL
jgi:hypothetical protein